MKTPLLAGALASLVLPLGAWAQPAPGAPEPFGVSRDAVFWVAFWIMTSLVFLSFAFVATALLRTPSWSLGDAVSEEAGGQPAPLPVGTKPIMVASSSRLIALLGLLMIIGVFLGFAYYFLYSAFAGTLKIDDMKAVFYYLISGAVTFAPYLANQLRAAFSALGTPAPQPLQAPAPAQAAPLPMRALDAVG